MPNLPDSLLPRKINMVNYYYRNIPVIFCSAKGEEFDRYWGIKQGADAYMVKPCPRSEMLDAINRLLAQSISELN